MEAVYYYYLLLKSIIITNTLQVIYNWRHAEGCKAELFFLSVRHSHEGQLLWIRTPQMNTAEHTCNNVCEDRPSVSDSCKQ